MNTYNDFLATKRTIAPACGFEASAINPAAFPFQADVIRWACRRGRAGLFLDTGLGKSLVLLEWARLVCQHTGGNVLVLAPLAVSYQLAREGAKFGIAVNVCASHADVKPGINVTNYEKLHHFDASAFGGVVCDEASVLKASDSKTRQQLTDAFRRTPYKLLATATPSPNDHTELGQYAAFLGVMTYQEMLSMFFMHDGANTSSWRLKRHAVKNFYRWLSSWAIACRKPSDIGYDDTHYLLPALHIEQVTVAVTEPTQGYMFAVEAQTLHEQRQARRDSLQDRVQAAAAIVASAPDAQWMLWCDLNDESAALTEAIPSAVEVKGSDSDEHKARAMLDFAAGNIQVLVSKPSICGFGMNWQQCSHTIFVGVSHSFEAFYQAIRRFWRFGQQNQVYAYVVIAETEGAVVKNIWRKAAEHDTMMNGLVAEMSDFNQDALHGTPRTFVEYQARQPVRIADWLYENIKRVA